MFSYLSRWIVLVITIYYLIINIHAQTPKENQVNTMNIDSSSKSIQNDDEDPDTEPLRGNGRGSHEANSQNQAAENNGTHGMPVEDFQQIILDQHNIYRRIMCANNLENDENLHRIAEKRAHSRANGNELSLPDDYNENIFEHDTGDPSKITGEMIVKSWYDQRQQYDINNESSATVFTQLVWKNTNKIGVGHAYNGHKLYVIVVYKPPGNIHGQFASNIGCNSNGQSNQTNR